MSSPAVSAPNSKTRRKTRACDNCRRRKGKCNGLPGSKTGCSICILLDVECTFNEEAKRRAPRHRNTKWLEHRVAVLESALRRANSEVPSNDPKRPEILTPSSAQSCSPYHLPSSLTEHAPPESDDSGDNDDQGPPLYELFAELDLNRSRATFNPSSLPELVMNTVKIDDRIRKIDDMRRSWENDTLLNVNPWEAEDISVAQSALSRHHYSFPEADLLSMLIDAYFTHYNVYMPLLHRPTFEYNLAENAHVRDVGFGAVVLAVCALGARYVDEEHVRLPGCSPQSAGWRWYNQLQMSHRPMVNQPRLVDVQLWILVVMFLTLTANAGSIWIFLGMAQRTLVEIGAHRQRFYSKVPNLRDELWKRAFWVTWSLDISYASSLGRPSQMHEDDYDVDYPIDCDDEFWLAQNPQEAFLQPSDRLSPLTYFIYHLKLQQIQSSTMHLLLSPKGAVALGTPSKVRGVAIEIDSEMNRWLGALPGHFQWDPNCEHPLFFHQSAMLKTQFYGLQMLVHRPFSVVKNPNLDPEEACTSMAVCASAARASINILSLQSRRKGAPLYYFSSTSQIFSAALTLLLDLHDRDHPRSQTALTQEMKNVKICIDLFSQYEKMLAASGLIKNFLLQFMPSTQEQPPLIVPSSSPRQDQNDDLRFEKNGAGKFHDRNAHLHANNIQPNPSSETTRSLDNTAHGLDTLVPYPSWSTTDPMSSLGYMLPPSAVSGELSTSFTDITTLDLFNPYINTAVDDLFAIWAPPLSGLGSLDWNVYLGNLDNNNPAYPQSNGI